MPKHFSAIGFTLDDAEALKCLAHQAVSQGEAFHAQRQGLPEGLFLWDLGRGLQVWVAARIPKDEADLDEAEIVACWPGFKTEDCLRFRAYRMARNAQSEGEIRLRGRLASGAELELALLNLAQADRLPASGADLPVHVAGLALEARLEDPAAADAAVTQVEDEDGHLRQLDSYLMPVDRDHHYTVMGRVVQVRDVVNFHTGAKLLALGVETSELELPVIVPASLLTRPVTVGLRFSGMLWLQAQLAAEVLE